MAQDRGNETGRESADTTAGPLWEAFASHHDEQGWHVADDLAAPEERRQAG
ncbi:hypothetical protein H7J07_04780 [Mycobacterium koreense]|uniref:hypothetical protein n=1 Tax=Mycolicibacillus koreensis TaxID=1069220 RepID=UPI00138DBA40|nr:hypothetical protein [Mycolicibacillus koreensis]MCV7247572.1 hypothetical protein [Mycolicibacillus koreensis]BBY53951.1 hypothetical protein MKOR_12020 [Mycolicibacillus koreensis]